MKINSPFTIVRADVILSSISSEDLSVDIKNNIMEVKFYENLYKPYIDAKIVFLDDFGFRTSLSAQGTERILISIGSSDDPSVPLFEKTFFISSILDSKRMNERSEILSIELVEEHFYVNSIKQISRSFTSKIEDMVKDICENELKKPVSESFFEGSAQGVRKVIAPYMNPLQITNWLLNRATTRSGAPIFLSADLYSNSLYMSDLDSLLQEPILNEDYPYRYSTASKGAKDQDAFLGPYYEIKTYTEINSENTLRLFETGSVGSFYENIDASTGRAVGSHLSVREILTEMYTSGMIDDATTQSIFDPSLEIDGKLSDAYNSQHIHQATSSNTYNQYLSYHDEATLLNETGDISESKLKVKNKIIRQLLKKNVMDISLDGISLFQGKISTGRRIRIIFLNSDMQTEGKSISDSIDKRKSGDYLILAISHKLISDSHESSMRVSKLGDLPKNFKI